MKNLPAYALACGLVLAAAMLASCGKEKGDEAATPSTSAPLAAVPDWAGPILGKKLDGLYASSSTCKGHSDVKQLHNGSPSGFSVEGWAWDGVGKTAAAHILFADSSSTIVGAAAGGLRDRPDVTKALPEVTSGKTGWVGTIQKASGKVTAFAITADNKACQFDTINLDQ